ncbi:MAG: hypothetical protein AB1898_07680 [Acidobacteriota bacterium]
MGSLVLAKRLGRLLEGVVLVVGFQILLAGAAQAHHVTIEATASCADGVAVINYTAGSWSLGLEGSNTQIDILVNGVVQDSGAFEEATGNTFSGSIPAPAGSSATVEARAVGDWGDGFENGQSASTTIDLPTDCGGVSNGVGRFTGGGYQILMSEAVLAGAKGAARRTVTDGVRITRGFTIHCDLVLSNNLEVNWEGNHFHMERHTSASCSDDPTIIQTPPKAPVDTIIGTGIGRYNNVEGYTIQFTLVDAGEPGNFDKAALKIYETANPGNVVLDVPLQPIAGGNVQAHFDQPHKQ